MRRACDGGRAVSVRQATRTPRRRAARTTWRASSAWPQRRAMAQPSSASRWKLSPSTARPRGAGGRARLRSGPSRRRLHRLQLVGGPHPAVVVAVRRLRPMAAGVEGQAHLADVGARFPRHHRRLALGRGVAELQCAEALPGAGLQLARHRPGVVRHHQLEARVGLHHLVALGQRQHAAGVGQRVDHHGGVGAGFHQLVQVADRAMPGSQSERPVLPARAVGVQQPAADQVAGAQVFMTGHGDQRAAQPPGHVLDEAGLAARRRDPRCGRGAGQPRTALTTRAGGWPADGRFSAAP